METATMSICPRHGRYEAEELVLYNGIRIRQHCPACMEAREMEDRAEVAQRAEQDRRARLKAAGIPPRFQHRGLGDYEIDGLKARADAHSVCCRYVREFCTVHARCGTGLVLTGNRGTGKTHLACGIANALLAKGVDVLYRLAFDVVQEIKATWDEDAEESESQIVNRYSRCGLLILDEVGRQFRTDTSRAYLFQIVNRRYNSMKPTVLISNLTTAELRQENELGEALVDRLTEGGGVMVPFAWESYRSKAGLPEPGVLRVLKS